MRLVHPQRFLPSYLPPVRRDAKFRLTACQAPRMMRLTMGSYMSPPLLRRLRIDGRLLLAGVGSVPVMLVAGLVLVVVWLSFQVIPPRGSASFGWRAYAELYGDPFVYQTLLNTGLFSLVTVVIAIFFGVAGAWLVERTDLPCKNVLFTFMTTGLLVPGFITAMGWVFLLHPRIGLINKAIMSIPGMEWASIDI